MTFTPDYDVTRPTLVPKGNGGTRGAAAAAPAAAPPRRRQHAHRWRRHPHGSADRHPAGGGPAPGVTDVGPATHVRTPVPACSTRRGPEPRVTELGTIADPLTRLDGLASACANKVQGKTQSQALAPIPNTLAGMLAWPDSHPPTRAFLRADPCVLPADRAFLRADARRRAGAPDQAPLPQHRHGSTRNKRQFGGGSAARRRAASAAQ